MPRYTTKPAKSLRWSDDLETETIMHNTITVIEEGDRHEPTGLLSADGQDIYRVKDQIGFIRFD